MDSSCHGGVCCPEAILITLWRLTDHLCQQVSSTVVPQALLSLADVVCSGALPCHIRCRISLGALYNAAIAVSIDLLPFYWKPPMKANRHSQLTKEGVYLRVHLALSPAPSFPPTLLPPPLAIRDRLQAIDFFSICDLVSDPAHTPFQRRPPNYAQR